MPFNMNKIKEECEKIFNDLRDITCCFTGHRSQKLPWRFNEQDERCLQMKENAKQEIISAINRGYIYFISGMAIGFDMICAELVLELKKQYPQIKLVCAIPCKGQEKVWNSLTQKRYNNIIKQADKKVVLAEKYTPECMLDRNRYMINNSSLCIALFDGKPGGTAKTIKFAEENDVEVIKIKP